MSNERIDEAHIKLMLTGLPEGSPERDRAEYTLTALTQLTAQVASITQHCRYCDDNDGSEKAPAGDPEQARQTWAMWGVTRWLLDRVLAVAIAAILTCVITLALTGQL